MDARLMSGILLVSVPDSIRRLLFAEAVYRADAGDETFSAADQFLSSGACACGRAGDSLLDLPNICGARGAGTRIRVAGANRCSAGRHSDAAGVLSFSFVHAGSPE